MGRRLSRGGRIIKWIEDYCVIPEGRDVQKPVKLRPWQKKEIRKIYDNPAGTRRAIVSWGRKNAKSALAAMLLLAHICGPESRRNAQLYSAAQSQKQAALIFDLAQKMIRMSPDLSAVLLVKGHEKEILCPELGTRYRALSAEVATSFGLSPVFIIHDELGQVRGPTSELYTALESATGAQENPLSLIISTQAPSDNDLLSQLIDDALLNEDPRVTLSLHCAPKDADPFSEKTIRKANPAFGDFLNAAEVMGMANDAKRMPALEAEYRNYVLNQRVQASNPFISEQAWRDCGGPVDKEWGNTPVFGAFDLAEVKDLTCLILMAKVKGIWQVKPHFWLPGDGITERSRTDHVGYEQWSKEGHLELTPGKTVDYEWVALRARQILKPLNVQKIAFDKWNWSQFEPWLIRAGWSASEIEKKFYQFPQNYQNMSPALRTLEALVTNKQIAHANHPVLSMCAANAVVHRDPNGNRKLDKAKSHGRIDGMVALGMTAGIAESIAERPKKPQLMFF